MSDGRVISMSNLSLQRSERHPVLRDQRTDVLARIIAVIERDPGEQQAREDTEAVTGATEDSNQPP